MKKDCITLEYILTREPRRLYNGIWLKAQGLVDNIESLNKFYIKEPCMVLIESKIKEGAVVYMLGGEPMVFIKKEALEIVLNNKGEQYKQFFVDFYKNKEVAHIESPMPVVIREAKVKSPRITQKEIKNNLLESMR